MQQLYPHRAQHRPPVQEKEVATTARVFDRVLDEVHNSVRLELRAAAEAEITCVSK